MIDSGCYAQFDTINTDKMKIPKPDPANFKGDPFNGFALAHQLYRQQWGIEKQMYIDGKRKIEELTFYDPYTDITDEAELNDFS